MTLKIGDKIRYLNNVGGGTVIAIQGKNIAIVEEPDGFQTPVLIKECVVIEESTIQVRHTLQPTPQIQKETPQPQPCKIEEYPGGDKLNILLAHLPVNPKKLQETPYETYLINDSNYYLHYNYMSMENNQWKSRNTGTIEPNTKIYLEEIEKTQLNEIEKICLQTIAYKKDKPYQFKNTHSVETRVDTVKFYKLHTFKENDYFDEPALIIPLVINDQPVRHITIEPEELRKAILTKDTPRNKSHHAKPHQHPQTIEVDLHINQLLDNTNGMSNAEILEYQLTRFRQELENNKNKKGQKIIFIHGKGEGVLRKAILDYLKHHHKNYETQDASFREYGYGATQVTIR